MKMANSLQAIGTNSSEPAATPETPQAARAETMHGRSAMNGALPTITRNLRPWPSSAPVPDSTRVLTNSPGMASGAQRITAWTVCDRAPERSSRVERAASAACPRGCPSQCPGPVQKGDQVRLDPRLDRIRDGVQRQVLQDADDAAGRHAADLWPIVRIARFGEIQCAPSPPCSSRRCRAVQKAVHWSAVTWLPRTLQRLLPAAGMRHPPLLETV